MTGDLTGKNAGVYPPTGVGEEPEEMKSQGQKRKIMKSGYYGKRKLWILCLSEEVS